MADRPGWRFSLPRERRLAGRLLRSVLHRLDTAAARLNPFLMLIVIGLAILYLSCFSALRLAPLARMAAPPAVAGIAALPVPFNR